LSYQGEEGESKPRWKPSEHLHLIREIPPDSKPGRHVNKVFCVGCQKTVFIICLDLPTEDPPLTRRARQWLKGDPKLRDPK
jgi:hypothetical protein